MELEVALERQSLTIIVFLTLRCELEADLRVFLVITLRRDLAYLLDSTALFDVGLRRRIHAQYRYTVNRENGAAVSWTSTLLVARVRDSDAGPSLHWAKYVRLP